MNIHYVMRHTCSLDLLGCKLGSLDCTKEEVSISCTKITVQIYSMSKEAIQHEWHTCSLGSLGCMLGLSGCMLGLSGCTLGSLGCMPVRSGCMPGLLGCMLGLLGCMLGLWGCKLGSLDCRDRDQFNRLWKDENYK